MFCSRCGKEVPDSAAFCESCGNPLHSAAPAYQPASNYQPVPTAPVQSKGKMEGFGRALTGAIFGLVSLIFGIVIVSLLSDAYSYSYGYYGGYSYVDEDAVIAAWILSTPAIVFGILSIVFGAKSIGTFKRAPQGQKPLVTLILGITSLTLGVVGLIMSTYGMIDGTFMLIE